MALPKMYKTPPVPQMDPLRHNSKRKKRQEKRQVREWSDSKLSKSLQLQAVAQITVSPKTEKSTHNRLADLVTGHFESTEKLEASSNLVSFLLAAAPPRGVWTPLLVVTGFLEGRIISLGEKPEAKPRERTVNKRDTRILIFVCDSTDLGTVNRFRCG